MNWKQTALRSSSRGGVRRDAWCSGMRDRAAILAAYTPMSDLSLTVLETSLDARDRAQALLRPQQRDQLLRFGPN
jgi:hypothetical protein